MSRWRLSHVRLSCWLCHTIQVSGIWLRSACKWSVAGTARKALYHVSHAPCLLLSCGCPTDTPPRWFCAPRCSRQSSSITIACDSGRHGVTRCSVSTYLRSRSFEPCSKRHNDAPSRRSRTR